MSELPSIIEYSDDVASAEEPDPLPVGKYHGEIRAVEQKQSQRGNNYAAVQFFIDTDQYPPDYDLENAPDGTILTYNRVTLSDDRRGRARMRKFCEAIGATPSRTIDLNDWIGLRAELDVVHDEYEGEMRAQIKAVNLIV